MRSLRRYLLEGLALVGPVGLTVFVLVWIFRRLDGILGRFLYPVLGSYSVPGLGVLGLVILLVFAGWLAEKVLGARLVAKWDELLRKVPVARRVYGGSSRIFRTVLGEGRYAFREVVLFEYPGPGSWSLGFVTGPAPEELEARFEEEGVTIYMPTAPNPMSGYLLMLPRSRVRPLDVTVEQAFTFVVSAGAVSLSQAEEVLAGGESGAPSSAGGGAP